MIEGNRRGHWVQLHEPVALLYLLARLSSVSVLNPPTKAVAKYVYALLRLEGSIKYLVSKKAIQSGGGFWESTAMQLKLHDEPVQELRDIERTADAISEEQDNPALMDRFRMPSGSGDTELKSLALGMAHHQPPRARRAP